MRLALLDNQTLFRESLAALVEREVDLETIAEAPTVQALCELDIAPHIAVTGLALPDARRSLVVGRLKERFPDSAIVALTVFDDLPTVQQVLTAGAHGYVLKSAAASDLFAGIRTVAHGGLYLQPSIGIAFASRPPDEIAHPAVSALTPKETDVLRLLALGHTNGEIAQLLGTSMRTIETHRAHIHQKIDRHRRAELVRFALDVGLLQLDHSGAPLRDARIASRQDDFVRGRAHAPTCWSDDLIAYPVDDLRK